MKNIKNYKLIYKIIISILFSVLIITSSSCRQDKNNDPAQEEETPGTTETPDIPAFTPLVPMGVNIVYFTTWAEAQPLANVAQQSRTYDPVTYDPYLLSVDSNGDPDEDFNIIIYEGSNPGYGGGGAQYGTHYCRFNGIATITSNSVTIENQSYNAITNTTTFDFATSSAGIAGLSFTDTQRTSASGTNTGITNLKIMRPGHDFDDFLNYEFTSVMEPFGCFRVGPNWNPFTYATTNPVWSERCKPDKIQYGGVNGRYTASWEELIAMANELQCDLWICLPPFADESYWNNIFNIFMYGSNGVDPYTSVQASPEWKPLDSNLKLYFEVGNELWNTAPPYGTALTELATRAQAEIDAGDANHYLYQGETTGWYRTRSMLGYLTVRASLLCRAVVGDSRMMTRFRPVLAGQSAYDYLGELSLSYIRCVYGGYNWYTGWNDGNFPGKPQDLVYTEDGVTENSYGIAARPITYYVYGYAVAPYISGTTISELQSDLVDTVQDRMLSNIETAEEYDVVPLAYEGGLDSAPSGSYDPYQEVGFEELIEDYLNYWFENGGDLFCYFGLAGGGGYGLIPDLTRQNPEDWPKLKAVRDVVGLEE